MRPSPSLASLPRGLPRPQFSDTNIPVHNSITKESEFVAHKQTRHGRSPEPQFCCEDNTPSTIAITIIILIAIIIIIIIIWTMVMTMIGSGMEKTLPPSNP